MKLSIVSKLHFASATGQSVLVTFISSHDKTYKYCSLRCFGCLSTPPQLLKLISVARYHAFHYASGRLFALYTPSEGLRGFTIVARYHGALLIVSYPDYFFAGSWGGSGYETRALHGKAR